MLAVIVIEDRNGLRVMQHGAGQAERHARVLLNIGTLFVRIPLKTIDRAGRWDMCWHHVHTHGLA